MGKVITDFDNKHNALLTAFEWHGDNGLHFLTEIGTQDSTFLVPVSVTLAFVILGILVGTFIGATPILTITIMSIISAMGAGGFFNYPLTSVTVTAPIIILTVAIANSVHVLSSFLDTITDKEQVLKASVEQNLQPVFLASITTAIGFLTMNFSEVPPFNHLGNIVSIGVIFSLTLLSLSCQLLLWLPVKPNLKINNAGKISLTLSYSKKIVLNRTQPILWFSIALIIVSLITSEMNSMISLFIGSTKGRL